LPKKAEEEWKDLSIWDVSKDVIETKGTYAFFWQSLQKLNLFKYNMLQAFLGPGRRKKRGDPKYEGKSKDVYENKGRKKSREISLEMLLKNKVVTRFSRDVYENKWT
jgi:hypothetical protein